MRRVGIIGAGSIATPVIRALSDGTAGAWRLAAVLAREARTINGIEVLDDVDTFLGSPIDLVIEAAGPKALSEWGVRALAIADVWTVSGVALADRALETALATAATASRHRLRLATGAIAGLDGVATAAVDPGARLHITISVAPTEQPRMVLFSGSVRDAAQRFPDGVNVAIAAALAGPGLDAATLDVVRPGPGEAREIRLVVESRYGRFETVSHPRVDPAAGVHTVAANLIAALRRCDRPVWVG